MFEQQQFFWFETGVDVANVDGGSGGEGGGLVVQLEIAWV